MNEEAREVWWIDRCDETDFGTVESIMFEEAIKWVLIRVPKNEDADFRLPDWVVHKEVVNGRSR